MGDNDEGRHAGMPLLGGQRGRGSFSAFLQAFWPLAFIAFGGPQAHVGLMHNKFVEENEGRTAMVGQATFLELFSVAQSLPGPSSTQLAVSLAASFGGAAGALLTFACWHLPGFMVMTMAGWWFHSHLADETSLALIHAVAQHAIGLIAAAYALVLMASFKIVVACCADDFVRMGIALACMFVAVCIPPAWSSWAFIVLLVAGGVVHFAYVKMRGVDGDLELEQQQRQQEFDEQWNCGISQSTGAIFLALCIAITLVVAILPDSDLGYRVLKIFWRVGLCVFGGGVVVIPMLLRYV